MPLPPVLKKGKRQQNTYQLQLYFYKNLNEKKNSRKKIIQPFSQSPRDWVIPGARAIKAF